MDDLQSILDTIVRFDENNKWNLIIYQVCFYCFRSFIEDRIVSSTQVIPWTSLDQLCEQFCDEEWKSCIDEIFNPDSLKDFEDTELLETFFINFTESFDELIKTEDTTNQDNFTEFLDIILFKFFQKNEEYCIFPTTIDEPLNLEKYTILRNKRFFSESKPISSKTFHKRLNGTPIRKKIIFSKTRKNRVNN